MTCKEPNTLFAAGRSPSPTVPDPQVGRGASRLLSCPSEYAPDGVYIDLSALFARHVHVKCEGLNLAGSVKIKAAAEMVDAAERTGILKPGGKFIESEKACSPRLSVRRFVRHRTRRDGRSHRR